MTLSKDMANAAWVRRHPGLVRCIMGIMSISPESLLLVIAFFAVHYGILIMFPESTLRTAKTVGESPTVVYAFITQLSWQWGFFLLVVGVFNVFAAFYTLCHAEKRYTWAMGAAMGDTVAWAWITFTFWQQGQPLSYCRVYIYFLLVSFFTTMLLSERRSRAKECEIAKSGDC
jgi:hypothetical protein